MGQAIGLDPGSVSCADRRLVGWHTYVLPIYIYARSWYLLEAGQERITLPLLERGAIQMPAWAAAFAYSG